jgi:tetratricopeptide (TPR) repeat protein
MATSILLFIFWFGPVQAADRVSFRMITVASEAKAAELRARVLGGESFDALARENSTDPSKSAGGFMGTFAPSDLRQELRTALSGLTPGQVSPVFKMGNEFLLVQLVAPEEVDWVIANAAALDALAKRRYAEAAASFSKAVQLAEKFGPDDERLGESLNGLGEAYALQENFAGAGAVYRRVLSIRWSGASNKGDLNVATLVDRFTTVLSLAYFPGPQYKQALAEYQAALNRTPVTEALYLAMSAILVKAELMAEAEDVMQRALRAFPASRRVRYKQAEMFRDFGKMRKALETFEQASQMKAPLSMPPELDRSQLSFIYYRMGGINTDLTQFDAAIAAYRKAVEILPDNDDARLALGDAYLRRGQQAEALAEFTRVAAARPDKASPHYRLADAHLQMGHFKEAAESAAKAIAIDPQQRKARYVGGTALVRMGRTDEGQKELEAYRKQEADAQTQFNNDRDVIVSNRGASALALEGKFDEAAALFRKSIEDHPDSPSLRVNLAVALSMSGRNRDAAQILQALLDSGLTDDFLVYRELARQYEILKDEKAGQKYAALYIRKVDAALEEELR